MWKFLHFFCPVIECNWQREQQTLNCDRAIFDLFTSCKKMTSYKSNFYQTRCMCNHIAIFSFLSSSIFTGTSHSISSLHLFLLTIRWLFFSQMAIKCGSYSPWLHGSMALYYILYFYCTHDLRFFAHLANTLLQIWITHTHRSTRYTSC